MASAFQSIAHELGTADPGATVCQPIDLSMLLGIERRLVGIWGLWTGGPLRRPNQLIPDPMAVAGIGDPLVFRLP